jgi:hypothetical protein
MKKPCVDCGLKRAHHKYGSVCHANCPAYDKWLCAIQPPTLKRLAEIRSKGANNGEAAC